MQHPPFHALMIMIASGFVTAGALFAHLRGKVVWQGILIGLVAWPFTLIVIDLVAKSDPNAKPRPALIPKSRRRRSVFNPVADILQIFCVNVFGCGMLTLLVYSFETGYIPGRHSSRNTYALNPWVFYCENLLPAIAGAVALTSGLAMLVYYAASNPRDE